QPDVTVLVALRTVAGEVEALEARPVGLLEALRVTPDAAQHARPRLVQDQVAALAVGVALTGVVEDVGADAGQRRLGGAGLGRGDAGQRRDHDRAGLGLPPGVHDRAAAATDHAVVPAPCLGVDRLAHAAQQAQGAEVVLRGDVLAPLHRRADRGGRGVEQGDLVLLDDLPPAALVREVRGALVDDLGGAVGHRAVDHVGVPGDPADVGRAPVHVALGLEV